MQKGGREPQFIESGFRLAFAFLIFHFAFLEGLAFSRKVEVTCCRIKPLIVSPSGTVIKDGSLLSFKR
jgi:hypothetical protein